MNDNYMKAALLYKMLSKLSSKISDEASAAMAAMDKGQDISYQLAYIEGLKGAYSTLENELKNYE